jgi:hypothetical protein
MCLCVSIYVKCVFLNKSKNVKIGRLESVLDTSERSTVVVTQWCFTIRCNLKEHFAENLLD